MLTRINCLLSRCWLTRNSNKLCHLGSLSVPTICPVPGSRVPAVEQDRELPDGATPRARTAGKAVRDRANPATGRQLMLL